MAAEGNAEPLWDPGSGIKQETPSRIDIRDPVLPGSTKENAEPHWYPRSNIKQETPSRIGNRIRRQSPFALATHQFGH